MRLALYGGAQPCRPVRERQHEERKRPQRHRARVHAPRGPAPQQPGQRDEGYKRAADPRSREHVPDALWVEPEPAERDGGEREEDEEDVVGGRGVAEEEAREEECADDGDLEDPRRSGRGWSSKLERLTVFDSRGMGLMSGCVCLYELSTLTSETSSY